jgi:DDE superfamily endonuclease
MPCTAPSIPLLEAFRPLFTAPTWNKMLTLLRGALLARGRRTVTAALWQTGHDQDPHFSAFHQVLNRARWSPRQASRRLLTLILQTFAQAGGSLEIVIDETLERRWGPKIRKRGHYRDSARSSHARSVSSPGLRWIVLAVVVGAPWTKQRWALPFLCVLATTPQVSARLGMRHKTLGAAGAPSGQSAAALVAGSPYEGARRPSLQHPGTGTPLCPAADHPDCAVALGLRAAPSSSRARCTHHWASPRRRPTPALSPARAPRSCYEVGPLDRGLVWRRATDCGTVYRNGLLVSLWLHSLAHSVGPHARSSGKTTAQSALFHRPNPVCRRDCVRCA